MNKSQIHGARLATALVLAMTFGGLSITHLTTDASADVFSAGSSFSYSGSTSSSLSTNSSRSTNNNFYASSVISVPSATTTPNVAATSPATQTPQPTDSSSSTPATIAQPTTSTNISSTTSDTPAPSNTSVTPTDRDQTPAGALLGEIGLGPDQSASASKPINGGMLQQAVSTIVLNNIPRIDEIAQGIETTYATTSAPVAVTGDVSQSGSRVPTAKEENEAFVSNEQMADMRISFISSLNINNVASIVGNGVTAVVGNVTNLGTSVANAIQNANNTPALVDGSGVIIGLTSAAATLGSGAFDLIGAVGNGLVRTINGEIKYPILSDEPDRVVLCATASILTTCNQTIHDLLQACDSAIAKLTNNGKTAGHTLICITGAIADSLANAIWDTAATAMNLAEIPHPHGLVAYV